MAYAELGSVKDKKNVSIKKQTAVSSRPYKKTGSILDNTPVKVNTSAEQSIAKKFGSVPDLATAVKNAGDAAKAEDSITNDEDTATGAYEYLQKNIDNMLSQYMRNGIRILGAPHQFIKQTDPRYGNSELGRTFAQKIMFEAPIVYLKPGKSEFLPGKNSKFRDGFKNAISNIKDKETKNSLSALLENDGADTIRYYGIKPDYSGLMTNVNTLCRILARLEGLDNVKVPWASGVTFGTYDWRAYKMESKYGNLKMSAPFTSAFENVFKGIGNTITGNVKIDDYEYIRFFAQPESSYSDSFSNSTTASMLENLTSQMESMAKELYTIGGIAGIDAQKLSTGVASATDTVNSLIGDYGGNSAIATGLKRITNTMGSVFLGGHIILPEMWGGSSHDNDFSFSVHLSCPYGNKLSRYIHIGVPMMFALAMVLPIMESPNVIMSPYLFQCFMPGFFNSEMCMISSVTFDKSTDGITMGNTLPSEVKINFGVKDLYSVLSMPKAHNIGDWMSNTGMMEFLAVQAGVDISRQALNDNFKMFTALLKDNIADHIQDTAYEIMMSFKHTALDWFKMLN